jgi:hypothetical protein
MGSRNSNRSYVYLWLDPFLSEYRRMQHSKEQPDDGGSDFRSCWCNECLAGGCDCTDGSGGLTAATASALTAEKLAVNHFSHCRHRCQQSTG